MENHAPRVLVVSEDTDVVRVSSGALESDGLVVIIAPSGATALDEFRDKRPRVVVLDTRLPDGDGLQLEQLLQIDPATEIILLADDPSTEAAVDAIKRGAADYLVKPVGVDTLRARIGSVLNKLKRRSELHRVERELDLSYRFQGIVGRSPVMLELFDRIRWVAPHYRSVLVSGETGTGKELVARALHACSPVAHGPFVVCNSAALVETLGESELFGHVRGSFTGAYQDRRGLFEHAEGGSLFLDEIGDMSQGMQAKLLRVLQDHQIQRVGSSTTRQIDIRVIAATNRDLRVEVAAGRFRQDLYFRLSMVEITLPALRQRAEDLTLLERYFVDKFAALYSKNILGISRRAQKLLAGHSWPGNVRELENVIGSAAMMTEESFIDIRHLPLNLLGHSPAAYAASGGANPPPEMMSLNDLEVSHAQDVLTAVHGNKRKAAAILGISRTTLYNMLARARAGGLPNRPS